MFCVNYIINQKLNNVRSLYRAVTTSSSRKIFSVKPAASDTQATSKTKTSTDHDKTHYDIIVAGGGMIGTTLACTLGKNNKLSNKRILLLESSKPFKWAPSDTYSVRVSAVSPGTKKLLESIGAWKHVEAVRYGTIKKLQVWDALSNAMITFNGDLLENVAYVVENDLLLNSVWKELSNVKSVDTLSEAKIKSYSLPNSNEDVGVELESGKKYTCNLLLGCDGVNSGVRNAMGVYYIKWDYDQMGVVATLQLGEANENFVAWQRFLPTGPIALLPLRSNVSSLVWSTSIAHAKQLLSMSDNEFIDAINEAIWKTYPANNIIETTTKMFDEFLKSMHCPSNTIRQLPPKIVGVQLKSRAAFPLGFGHAANYVGKNVALVGDAAHRVHPLAGQGVNLGFGDITCLNKILGEAVYSGSTLGDLTYLKQYETERQLHNVPTMLVIDGLHKLYNTEFTPIVVLRSLGLQFTHALTPLKKALINQAATN